MTPSFTLRQLGYFLAVADSSSLREAAALLHISESALASALEKLEKALKLQLCVRRKAQGITLTPGGRHLAERARKLLREAEGLENEAAGLQAVLSGPVKLGCPHGLAPSVLPRLLAGTREAHPGIEVSFELGHRAELLPRLLEGLLDLLVLPGAHLPDALEACFLYDAPVHAVLPAGHRLAAHEVVDLRDLAEEPLVLLDIPESREHATAMFAAIGRTPRIGPRSVNFELARSLVGWGFGYTLQVQRPWGDHTYDGLPLAVRPVTPALEDETVVIGWPRDMRLSARAEAVAGVAQQAFARKRLQSNHLGDARHP